MRLYAFSQLFAGVLANQAGVPLPIAPALIAAGTLSAHAGTGIASSILVTAVAALGLGRWRGRRALQTAARLLRRSADYVDSSGALP